MSDTRRPTGVLPMTPDNYPAEIPEFATEAQAREFWETHDSTYYWNQLEDVTDSPPAELEEGPSPEEAAARPLPRRGTTGFVSVPMSTEMIAELKAIAEQRHLPYQSLVRAWVGERLLKERTANGDSERKAS